MKLQSYINPAILNRSLISIRHPKVRITCIRSFSTSTPSMSSSTSNTVKVGVGIFLFKTTGDSFITGRRTGNTSVGQGTWALPGGHLEFGESFEECAEREVLEETGLKIKDVRFLTAMNNIMRDKDKGSHYVTIFMRASIQDESAEPEVLEPEKCEGWEWTTWDQMKRYYDLQVEGEKTGGFKGRKLFSPWGGLFEKMPGWRPE